jgi:hypothetical protein
MDQRWRVLVQEGRQNQRGQKKQGTAMPSTSIRRRAGREGSRIPGIHSVTRHRAGSGFQFSMRTGDLYS